jgi:hypothetical protein
VTQEKEGDADHVSGVAFEIRYSTTYIGVSLGTLAGRSPGPPSGPCPPLFGIIFVSCCWEQGARRDILGEEWEDGERIGATPEESLAPKEIQKRCLIPQVELAAAARSLQPAVSASAELLTYGAVDERLEVADLH